MKTYTVVTQSIQFHEYKVQAESMDEAKSKVFYPLQDGVQYIRTDSEPPTDDPIVHASCEEIKIYPFTDGDTYFTLDGDEFIESTCDCTSEEIHDANPDKVYYREPNKESKL